MRAHLSFCACAKQKPNVARSSVSAVDLVAMSDLLFKLMDQPDNVLVLHATSVVEALPAVVEHVLDQLDLVLVCLFPQGFSQLGEQQLRQPLFVLIVFAASASFFADGWVHNAFDILGAAACPPIAWCSVSGESGSGTSSAPASSSS